MSEFTIAICTMCRHYRLRPKTELFSPSSLQASGVLKAKLEWDQQEQERRQAELQRFEAGQPFTYEPFHYPWCAAYTPFDQALPPEMSEALSAGDLDEARRLAQESVARGWVLIKEAKNGDFEALQELAERGRATMNPVTGEVSPLYALCARMNPMGQCPLFEPKSSRQEP
jgi:hypothetical protein